ncbi:MAG: hypothetical protein KF810_01010 [Rhizobiaceae bacterium]|nr:hypothetical protein [Rhizobiaceae bacterium]
MARKADRIGIFRLATFLAALVLVLQSTLVMAAPPVERDIFGNVICAQGSAQMPSGQSKHEQDCCLLSCSMSPSVAAGPPAAIFIAAFEALPQPLVFPPQKTLARHHRRTPANPRAPPLAA